MGRKIAIIGTAGRDKNFPMGQGTGRNQKVHWPFQGLLG